MKCAVRVPGTRGYSQFEFLDDTGASHMFMFQADLDQVQQSCARLALPLGDMIGHTPNGTMVHPTYRLEVNIVDADHEPILDEWVPVRVMVKPGSQQSNNMDRLSGMWMRHVLYTATCPDNNGRLYVSKSRNGLFTQMPPVDYKSARPPPFYA